MSIISQIINEFLNVKVLNDSSNPVSVNVENAEKTFNSNHRVKLKGELKKIVIPTYEGSGQVVHPAVVYIPVGFGGYKYWLAITPYPNGNNQHENPCIYASHDGLDWKVPSGLTNPLVSAPASGYNSDTDLIYDRQANQLVCYYRPVISGKAKLVKQTSSNGVTWSAPIECTITGATDAPYSPQVKKVGVNKFIMVGMYSGLFAYYTSTNGTEFHLVSISEIPIEGGLWHLGAMKIDSGFIFTACVDNPVDLVHATNLYMGSSRSGQSMPFVDDLPIVLPTGVLSKLIYQSVIVKVEDGYRLYATGQDSDSKWNLAYVDVELDSPYATEGIIDELNYSVTIPAGENIDLVQRQSTYGATDLRIMIPHNSTQFDVKLTQDSTNLVHKKIIPEEGYDAGKVYSDKLYASRFTLNVKNNSASELVIKAKVLLIK